MGRSLSVALAALAFLALLAVFSAPAAAAPDPCKVGVEMNGGEMTAAVTSAAGAQAVSYVIVSFQKPTPIQAVIRIAATTDTGWPLTVDPDLQIVDSGSRAYFEVSVEVPPALAPGPAGTVHVSAQVTLGGYKCPVEPEASATMVVRPYLDAFSGQIPIGSLDNEGAIGRASFDILVRVRSNTAVHVAFLFSADPEIAVDAPASLDFPPSFSETVEGTIHVVLRAPGLRPGSHDVNITVRANGADLPPKDGLLGLTIFVPRHDGATTLPWADLAATASAGAAGTAVFFWWRRGRA